MAASSASAATPVTEPRVAILAEGLFAPQTAKTAIGVLRYASYPIVAVVDSTRAGRDSAEIVGIGRGIPVVATVTDAISQGASVVLIGTAAAGGRIPDEYRRPIGEALERGLEVWNGLHERVLADPELRGGLRVGPASDGEEQALEAQSIVRVDDVEGGPADPVLCAVAEDALDGG